MRGQRHGSGRLCYSESAEGADGGGVGGGRDACYDGQWAHGVRSGHGQFESFAFVYVGQWRHDAPHDATHGRMWFPRQGAAYAGGVVEGLPDGHGVMLHDGASSSSSSGASSGDGGGGVGGGVGSSGLGAGRYEGLFHKGLKHGHGAFVSAAGGTTGNGGGSWAYVGDWRWDHRHGLGQMATGFAARTLAPPGWPADEAEGREEAAAANAAAAGDGTEAAPLRDGSRKDGGRRSSNRSSRNVSISRSSSSSSDSSGSSSSSIGSSGSSSRSSGSDQARSGNRKTEGQAEGSQGTLYQVTLPYTLEWPRL